jgi:tetratricopeptide (TPR) repeat protein
VSQYNQKNYEEAEKNFKKLLDRDAENKFSYFNSLANLYRDKSDHDKAIEYYEKAIEANPKYEKAYINLAILYKDQFQDFDKYEEIMKRGLENISESQDLKK